jgi:hypothetical protein
MIPWMQEFATDREALDFLADRIVAEAKRENVSLSAVERKMLYFSETDWTLPDMAKVSASFDQDYDEDEYERKIAGLVSAITNHHHQNNRDEEEQWDAAVEKLGEGDHYISVLVNPSLSTGEGGRPAHDILKLWLTAAGIVVAGFASMAVFGWILGSRLDDNQDWLSFHNFGALIVVAPVVLLITIAVRRGWITLSGRN